MSGGKGRGKQSRDTASEDALVARPGATYPLLATREGPQTRRLMRFGKASRISLILPLFKTVALANRLRGLAQQRKASSPTRGVL